MNEPIIEVKNLSFSYNREKKTIADVSFVVNKGEYVSILGHNGSGKSTLAKLLIGLLDKNSGEIIVDSLPFNKQNQGKIRQKVALVFQNPDNQFIGITVEDDIAFGLENRRVPHNEMQAIIEKYAESVGMKDYLKREPSHLSGGQKQRVAIAGALALQPSILILDEATSMLDPKGKREIRELIEKMRKTNPDLTILSITHDVEEAYQSDEIIVLSEGKIILKDTPENIFKNEEELTKAGIDLPFITKVKKAFKENGIKIDDSVNDIDALVENLCQLK